jgi:hypothetical protein
VIKLCVHSGGVASQAPQAGSLTNSAAAATKLSSYNLFSFINNHLPNINSNNNSSNNN